MAPFLSFTAEEAWALVGKTESIFSETYWDFGSTDDALLSKWSRIREIRDVANKAIEAVRTTGAVGASLQAEIDISVAADDLALLQSLGEDLRFVFITSAARLVAGSEMAVAVTPSSHAKCERCWHYREDVGSNAAHPGLCARCDSNLHGAGETRRVA
jgi:isoleucyl-tRNA synthetase